MRGGRHLAFGPDGRLYVAQLDDKGWLAMEIGLGGAAPCMRVPSRAVRASRSSRRSAFGGAMLWGARLALIPGLADVVLLAP